MGKFNIVKTSIDGLVVIEPKVFGDARGFFFESYAERDFHEIAIHERFVQDNHSKSKKGVLRGLHFQTKHTQGKLIRVIAGAVLDVAVDLRPESPTFGKWESVELSANNKLMFYVPPRFAHGFLTLENETEFLYKCTDYYSPEHDAGLLWADPKVGIDWNLSKYGLTTNNIILSDKDKNQPTLNDVDWSTIWV